MREIAREKLSEIPGVDEHLAFNIEKSIYNAAVKSCNMPAWDNIYFTILYRQKYSSVSYVLRHGDLLQRIHDGNIKSSSVASMLSEVLWPEGPHGQAIQRKKDQLNENNAGVRVVYQHQKVFLNKSLTYGIGARGWHLQVRTVQELEDHLLPDADPERRRAHDHLRHLHQLLQSVEVLTRA